MPRVSPNKGKKFSLEWRQNLAQAHLGLKQSDSAKQKVSEFQRSLVQQGTHHLYTDGRSSNREYRNWQKNQRNRLLRITQEEKGMHTFDEWQSLKVKHNNSCASCEKSELETPLTIDHIIPLSKGGNDLIENIQPLCRSCNSRKLNKIINE